MKGCKKWTEQEGGLEARNLRERARERLSGKIKPQVKGVAGAKWRVRSR